MRYRFIPLFISLFLVFSSNCAKGPSELLLDSFEGRINKETVDFGSSENSFLKVTASQDIKACGEQSLKLDYQLNPSGYMWVARGYGLDIKGAAKWEVSPQDIKWPEYNAFSLSMYGRSSGGVIAFDIKDSRGELWRFFLDDDKSGWKEVICPLAEFFPRGDWQPEDSEGNQVLDFPIMSFQFEPRIIGRGVYYFDCIKLIRTK